MRQCRNRFKNPKSQNSSSREIPITKLQMTQMQQEFLGDWRLASLELGTWNLELGIWCFIPSGRRDSNPRPVAAATVLQSDSVELIATASRFIIELLSNGFCAIGKTFAVNQNPRNPVPCCFRVSGIVPSKTLFDVLTRSNVAATRVDAPQNVDVEHIDGAASGRRDSNPRPLEPHSSVLPS
jgi:hypothetical protein